MTSTVTVKAHNSSPVKISLFDHTADDTPNNPSEVVVPKGESREVYVHGNQAVRVEEVSE